jgi:hypothetical protein
MGVDKLKLYMGRPILVDKEHNIYAHQPLIKDVVDIGENGHNDFVLPYIMTAESVFNGVENEEELIERFHFFDLFFIDLEKGGTLLDSIFGRDALELLKDSLRYFLKASDIRVLKKRKKLIVDGYLIDEKEFDKIRKIVQSFVGREDIEVEKPPRNMTKRQKDVWMKLQKGRRRTAERNAIYLQDIINFVSFGGNSYIPIEQIDRMTYFYLQNAYKSIVGMDAYNMGMQYKLSQKYDVKEDVKHWTESLKVGK